MRMGKGTEQFPLIEVLNSVDVIYEGEKYMAQWSDLYRRDEIGKPKKFPSLLVVVDKNGDMLNDASGIVAAVKRIATEQRINELHEEFGTEPITDLETIQKILDRVWAGEWMGQNEFAGDIHRDTLRRILNLEPEEYWPVSDEIYAKGMAGSVGVSWSLYPPEMGDNGE